MAAGKPTKSSTYRFLATVQHIENEPVPPHAVPDLVGVPQVV